VLLLGRYLFGTLAVFAINKPEEGELTILFLDVFGTHRESDADYPL
jgi:hypothetical protein